MFDCIHEGPASNVYRTKRKNPDGSAYIAAVKTAPAVTKYSPEPHDIVKEARLLLAAKGHPNIVDVLHAGHDTARPDLYNIWMPYIPLALADLLDSPAFAPHEPNSTPFEFPEDLAPTDAFVELCRSLSYQLLSALAHLHGQGVAHRDIKPGNMLLTHSGCIVLIDFGIALELRSSSPPPEENAGLYALWPESPGSLYTQVGTGPYRAPELLFGSQDYNSFAIDLWATGASIAEFFTPLELDDEDDEYSNEDSDLEDSDDEEHCVGFIYPHGTHPTSISKWNRRSLFDASRGDIGLAWSIFQLKGTPDKKSWPGFLELPHAQKLTFTQTPGVPIASRLPNLSTRSLSAPSETQSPARPQTASNMCLSGQGSDNAIDLIESLMVYPPDNRLRATRGLQHTWLRQNPVMVPRELLARYDDEGVCDTWGSRDMGQWLSMFLRPRSNSHREDGD